MDDVRHFEATLERLRGGLGWLVARVPFDPREAWPKMVRRRVVVELAGERFRTSLFAEQPATGHFLLINKKMQAAAAVGEGGLVQLAVAPDLVAREAVVPPELARLLRSDKALQRWFGTNSESMRREMGKWVDDAKGPATRKRRAEQMAERLLQTMQAETTLPPILDRAFIAQPTARAGWDVMTETQRRNHLLGLFYYQSPEAQAKRLAKLIEEALRKAPVSAQVEGASATRHADPANG
jgi:uncharacterized protein YdeI (YjbR/CyaY-like superfamily)